MSSSHITKEQRFKIQSFLELKMSQTDIAERLGKNKSAVCREIARNSYEDGRYSAEHAAVL